MGVFDRTVCAIDDGSACLEAVRQAEALAPAGRQLVLAAVIVPTIVSAGVGMDAVLPEADDEGRYRANIERAQALVADGREAESLLLDGPPIAILNDLLAERQATVVAFGVHEHGRLAGIIGGSVGTALLHDAACSILAARPPAEEGGWPRSIVVGLDGSDAAAAALDAAAELAERTGAELRGLVAAADETDSEAVGGEAERRRPGLAVARSELKPVEALVAATADLLVVGSRGLRGLKTLGSVSERVAHKATCSVLVVR